MLNYSHSNPGWHIGLEAAPAADSSLSPSPPSLSSPFCASHPRNFCRSHYAPVFPLLGVFMSLSGWSSRIAYPFGKILTVTIAREITRYF